VSVASGQNAWSGRAGIEGRRGATLRPYFPGVRVFGQTARVGRAGMNGGGRPPCVVTFGARTRSDKGRGSRGGGWSLASSPAATRAVRASPVFLPRVLSVVAARLAGGRPCVGGRSASRRPAVRAGPAWAWRTGVSHAAPRPRPSPRRLPRRRARPGWRGVGVGERRIAAAARERRRTGARLHGVRAGVEDGPVLAVAEEARPPRSVRAGCGRGEPRAQGFASITRLKGVSAATRTRENPASRSTASSRAGPAWAPSAAAPGWSSETGVQIIVEAA
jgi:hypothetical protein